MKRGQSGDHAVLELTDVTMDDIYEYCVVTLMSPIALLWFLLHFSVAVPSGVDGAIRWRRLLHMHLSRVPLLSVVESLPPSSTRGLHLHCDYKLYPKYSA